MLYRPVEGSVGREGANVALVEDAPWQRHPPPVAVAPPERGVADHLGRPVNAAGLECRPGVGRGRPAVQAEGVVGARACLVHGTRPPAACHAAPGRTATCGTGHRQAHATQDDFDAAAQRRPDPELVHQPSRPSTATGNRRSSASTLTSPPSTLSPVSTSTQVPPGSATVQPAQPSRSPPVSRGTTTARPPVRVKATTCEGPGPDGGRGWGPGTAPQAP